MRPKKIADTIRKIIFYLCPIIMCGFFPHCNFISTVLSIVFPLLLVRELNFFHG